MPPAGEPPDRSLQSTCENDRWKKIFYRSQNSQGVVVDKWRWKAVAQKELLSKISENGESNENKSVGEIEEKIPFLGPLVIDSNDNEDHPTHP